MSFLDAIRKGLSVIVLGLLLLVTLLVLRFVPEAREWSMNPFFLTLPYLVFSLAFVLGACFHQSRISFISLFALAMMAFIWQAGLSDAGGNATRHQILVFLSSLYLPLLALVFYHMKEQGLLTPQGYVKVAIVVAALVVLLLVPQIPELASAVAGPDRGWFAGHVSSWLPIPRLGALLYCLSVPFLLIPLSHESPRTGPLLALALLFLLLGLGHQSSIWPDAAGRAAFVLLNTGAGMVAVWLVLESAWCHANIDELTQLPNRRALKVRMDSLGRSYGLAIADIDHFKKINDKYGHDTGDHVLRYVAAQMKKSGLGHVYRYGGEEFVIVMTRQTDIKEFVGFMEDMREEVGGRPFVIRGVARPPRKSKKKISAGSKQSIKVTISIGAALESDRHDGPGDVLRAADKALYRAKKAGRNRVKSAR